MVFQVVNSGKENFDMQDEFLGHPDGVEILSVANLPQHVGYARGARLLEGRQHAARSQFRSPWLPALIDQLTSISDKPAVPSLSASP